MHIINHSYLIWFYVGIKILSKSAFFAWVILLCCGLIGTVLLLPVTVPFTVHVCCETFVTQLSNTASFSLEHISHIIHKLCWFYYVNWCWLKVNTKTCVILHLQSRAPKYSSLRCKGVIPHIHDLCMEQILNRRSMSSLYQTLLQIVIPPLAVNCECSLKHSRN